MGDAVRRLVVIPAAGTGSRLDVDGPKAVATVAGRPMLHHLLDLYGGAADGFVVVIRPEQEDAVGAVLAECDAPVGICYQERPTGMLDALLIAADEVRGREAAEVWITWCDQVAVLPATVRRLAGAGVSGQGDGGPALALPTVSREEPYTHFVRDDRGRIVGVLQRREGDAMPATGESDTGLFAFRREVFVDDLPRYARDAPRGRVTGDRNFLPFVPWLGRRREIRTVEALHPMESVGVNTPEERRRVGRFLAERAEAVGADAGRSGSGGEP